MCTVCLYSAFQRVLNACVSKLLVAESLGGIHYVSGYNSHYFPRWEKVRSLDSAAGEGLTNIMENHTFVPRARYLRLLRHIRR